MTTTPTPSPEAEALPTLPVVAYIDLNGNPWREDDPDVAYCFGAEALSLRAPAEAAIVALRAEVAELRKERDALQEKVRDYALQLLVDDAQAMGLYDTPGSLLGDGGTLPADPYLQTR